MRLPSLVPAFVLAVMIAGCKPKPPTSPHCVHNTELQFKRIDDNHAKYKAGATPPGAVYWARYYLETARFVLTGTGIDGSGAACTGPDRHSKDFERLMMGLEARSHDVEWMETQRGVKFKSTTGNRLTWAWQKTGEDVANNDANTL
jgi:hypothetical protein